MVVGVFSCTCAKIRAKFNICRVYAGPYHCGVIHVILSDGLRALARWWERGILSEGLDQTESIFGPFFFEKLTGRG